MKRQLFNQSHHQSCRYLLWPTRRRGDITTPSIKKAGIVAGYGTIHPETQGFSPVNAAQQNMLLQTQNQQGTVQIDQAILSDQFNFADANNFSDPPEQIIPKDQRTTVPTKSTKQQLLEAEIDQAFHEVFVTDQPNPTADNSHAAAFDEMADDLYQTMLQEQAKEETAAGLLPAQTNAAATGWTNGGTIPYNTAGETPASLPAAMLASLLSDPFALQTYLRQYWDTAKNCFSAANLLLGLHTSPLPALAGAEGGNPINYDYDGAYADQLNRSFKQFAVQEGKETSRNPKYNSNEQGRYAGNKIGEKYPLYRQKANTGEFSKLKEPMTIDHVKMVCENGGMSYSGIKIKIVEDSQLVGSGFLGYTHPSGQIVELYPDAFTNRETLIKTLGHERIHVMQNKLYGPPQDRITCGLFEDAATKSESDWWNYYKNVNGGY
jgi:hypothetical protein